MRRDDFSPDQERKRFDVPEHITDLNCASLAPRLRAGHMIGLQASDGLPANLAGRLAERNVYVGARGSSIRVSPHLHSSTADIERLAVQMPEGQKVGEATVALEWQSIRALI